MRNELPPNPTRFNVTDRGFQFLINPKSEEDARQYVASPNPFIRQHPILTLFDLSDHPVIRVSFVDDSTNYSAGRYSVDGAMAKWDSLIRDGWEMFTGEYWFKRTRAYGLGILFHDKVEDYQSIDCIKGKVADLGHGCCILEYTAAAMNPNFHRRKRQIVVKA